MNGTCQPQNEAMCLHLEGTSTSAWNPAKGPSCQKQRRGYWLTQLHLVQDSFKRGERMRQRTKAAFRWGSAWQCSGYETKPVIISAATGKRASVSICSTPFAISVKSGAFLTKSVLTFRMYVWSLWERHFLFFHQNRHWQKWFSLQSPASASESPSPRQMYYFLQKLQPSFRK